MAITGPRLLLLAILIVLTVFVYWRGLSGPFFLDDYANTLQVAPATASFGELFDIATRNESGLLRRPIPNLSFAANFLISGHTPFNYKAFNLAIHLACSFVVLALTITLARFQLKEHYAEAAGWTAAFLWAVHPLHASTVLYIVQRMAQLSCLFILLATLVYARWRLRIETATLKNTAITIVVTGAFGLLSLLSKENAILLPLLLASVEIYARGCLPHNHPTFYSKWAQGALILAPSLLLIGGVIFTWQFALSTYTARDFSLSERLATQPVVHLTYLKQLLLPSQAWMSLFHDDFKVYNWDHPYPWLASGGIATLLLAAFAARRRAPELSLATFWFFSAHLLEGSIYGLEMVWEHRNYLPSTGLIVGITIFAWRTLPKIHTYLPIAVATAATLLLSGSCLERSIILSSNSNTATHQLKFHPMSMRTLTLQLGEELRSKDSIAIQLRINQIIDVEKHPLKGRLLGVLASCETGPYWPHIYSSIAEIQTTPFEKGYAPQIETIVDAYTSGQCELIPAWAIKAIIDGALANQSFSSDAKTLQFILLSSARVARYQGAHNHEVEAILLKSYITDRRNSAPLIQAVLLYLRQGDTQRASILLQQLKADRENYSRKIDHIIIKLTERMKSIEAENHARGMHPNGHGTETSSTGSLH